MTEQQWHYHYQGTKFGYPECCIKHFMEKCTYDWWFYDLPYYNVWKDDENTLKLEGYIPCEKCSNKPRQVLVDEINSRRKIVKIK